MIYLRKQVKHDLSSWDFYPDGLTWITRRERREVIDWNMRRYLHVDNVLQLLRKVSMDRFEEPERIEIVVFLRKETHFVYFKWIQIEISRTWSK
jgi:hypothetical protein